MATWLDVMMRCYQRVAAICSPSYFVGDRKRKAALKSAATVRLLQHPYFTLTGWSSLLQ